MNRHCVFTPIFVNHLFMVHSPQNHLVSFSLCTWTALQQVAYRIQLRLSLTIQAIGVKKDALELCVPSRIDVCRCIFQWQRTHLNIFHQGGNHNMFLLRIFHVAPENPAAKCFSCGTLSVRSSAGIPSAQLLDRGMFRSNDSSIDAHHFRTSVE